MAKVFRGKKKHWLELVSHPLAGVSHPHKNNKYFKKGKKYVVPKITKFS
jgi:hypothetical protein